MEPKEAYEILAEWLLTRDSSAAAWLAKYPQLFLRLETPPGRFRPEGPPPLPEPFDEEAAQSSLRLWLGRSMAALNLTAIQGRSRPEAVLNRLSGVIGQAVERALTMADLSLRQRFHHPLFLPATGGPGPVAVLAWGPLAGQEAAFNQAVGLFFLFTRQPGFAGPQSEEDLDQALGQSRQVIILREYVLKAAGRILTFLGMEHPAGPSLSTAVPEGWSQALVGPQINSLNRFSDFFSHRADPAQLFSLTRMVPLAGQAKLGREVIKLGKRLLVERFSDRALTAATLDRLRSRTEKRFDPATNPGGLSDLGLLIDGLLLSHGVWTGRTTRSRLKKALEMGLLGRVEGAALVRAHAALVRAHLICSALERPPEEQNQYEAALALWPNKKAGPDLSLARAREIVNRHLDRFVQGG